MLSAPPRRPLPSLFSLQPTSAWLHRRHFPPRFISYTFLSLASVNNNDNNNGSSGQERAASFSSVSALELAAAKQRVEASPSSATILCALNLRLELEPESIHHTTKFPRRYF